MGGDGGGVGRLDIFWNSTAHQLFVSVNNIFILYNHLQVPEIKDLVIDPQLMKPLDHFTGASFLKVITKSLNYLNSAQDSCQSSCDL